MRTNRGVAVAISLLALGLVSACGGDDPFEDPDSTGTGTTPSASSEPTESGEASGDITVSGANFTEMLVMEEIYAGALRDAGFNVEIISVDNREAYEASLESGEIDVVPEYAATLTEFLNIDENGPDAETMASSDVDQTIEALRSLAEPRGLTVLDPAEASSQNAFFVTQDFATENDLATLSDLAALGEPLVLAATAECPERPFCQLGLESVYGLDISEVLPLGYGTLETKESVSSGESQLGLSGTTDGSLEAAGLVVLEDDEGLQNADNLTPLVNSETLAEFPEIQEILDAISAVLTTEILADLNARVDVDRELASDVAADFLTESGLVG